MPCRFAFILVILISALSPCQESTVNSHNASLSGTVVQGNTHLPLKSVQVLAIRSSDSADDDDDSGTDRKAGLGGEAGVAVGDDLRAGGVENFYWA